MIPEVNEASQRLVNLIFLDQELTDALVRAALCHQRHSGGPSIPIWSRGLHTRYSHNTTNPFAKRSTWYRHNFLGMPPFVRDHLENPANLPCLSHQLRRPRLRDWAYRHCMEYVGEWHASTERHSRHSSWVVLTRLCGRPCYCHICALGRRLVSVLQHICECCRCKPCSSESLLTISLDVPPVFGTCSPNTGIQARRRR